MYVTAEINVELCRKVMSAKEKNSTNILKGYLSIFHIIQQPNEASSNEPSLIQQVRMKRNNHIVFFGGDPNSEQDTQ